MSKYVKNLISEHLRDRLGGLNDALLVNMIGLDANTNNRLRTELQQKNIRVMVVKNSLAARATAGTPLASMFEELTGCSAICWGGEDLVSLTKEVVRLQRDEQYAAFRARGGVMDGQELGRSGPGNQQVAQPPGAVELADRSDSRAGCPVGGPGGRPGRDARRPDRPAGG